jgi:hypothetical protein
MQYKVYLISILLLSSVKFSYGQTDYQKTDSISMVLYNEAKWSQLIIFGKSAISKGDDFPALRLRTAYAAFQLGNYSLALAHYEKVLTTDHYHQTALYYAYLCNSYLNRPKEASYLVKYIDGKSVDGVLIKPTFLTQVGAETALKFTDNINRGNSNYIRLFSQLRASYNLHIDYSVFLYNQALSIEKINQTGNHLKLSYTPIKNISLVWAWNYMNTTYLQANGASNALLLGVKYAHPYFNTQVDAIYTNNDGEIIRQYNFQLLNYLSGNLNFYINNRISYLNSTRLKSIVYSPSIGVKPIDKLWLEVGGNFGNQYYFSEADGLYQYNSQDITTFKSSTNAYYLLKNHLFLNLGYTLEKRTDHILNFNYLQHSINAGITWNF